jgi:hypothetical protein
MLKERILHKLLREHEDLLFQYWDMGARYGWTTAVSFYEKEAMVLCMRAFEALKKGDMTEKEVIFIVMEVRPSVPLGSLHERA